MEEIVIILMIFAGVFNALMDLSAEGKLKSGNPNRHDWLNKELSWRYKYKNQDVDQGPRFFLSTTALVFLTDGWHLFQFLFHTCWQMSIAIWTPYPVIAFIVIKTLFSGIFHQTYEILKKL